MKFKITLFCLVAFTTCAFSQNKVQAYIDEFAELAIQEMIRTGVPAAIKLAQGIVETQSGESELVKKSNNHFGIKCKTEWTGDKVYHDDDAKGECFRAYPTAEASYRDHSNFLKTRAHYAFLFDIDPTDYKAWAAGLRKAGYATNPSYPQRLIKIIEEYNLQAFTLTALNRMKEPAVIKNTVAATEPSTPSEPSSNTTSPNLVKEVEKTVSPTTIITSTTSAQQQEQRFEQADAENEMLTEAINNSQQPTSNYPNGIFSINNTKVMYAKAGTSLLAIANAHQLSLKKLLEFNELEEEDILTEDQLIFLEKKPKKSEAQFYTTTSQESPHQIAQKNGIRLDQLLLYNKLNRNDLIPAGKKILLREATLPKSKAITKK